MESDIKNSYMTIEAETKHPILVRVGGCESGRSINTIQRVEVKGVASFPNPPLTRIPSYPDLPMEEGLSARLACIRMCRKFICTGDFREESGGFIFRGILNGRSGR